MKKVFGIFIAATSLLAVLVNERASAEPKAVINPASVSTVNCIYNLLRANSTVSSISVYKVDGRRSAVEFSFLDTKYGIITADIGLSGGQIGDRATYSVSRFSPDESHQATEDKGFRSADFVGKLLAKSCSVTPAFDSIVPLPSPRPEWQEVDWPIQPTAEASPVN
jgi:hypothetical protein